MSDVIFCSPPPSRLFRRYRLPSDVVIIIISVFLRYNHEIKFWYRRTAASSSAELYGVPGDWILVTLRFGINAVMRDGLIVQDKRQKALPQPLGKGEGPRKKPRAGTGRRAPPPKGRAQAPERFLCC